MLKRRFFASLINEAAPSPLVKRSNVYDFLTPESEPIYRNTMNNYGLAKKFLQEGQIDKASIHIGDAIKESSRLRGQTPAISSIRMDLFELEDAIELVRCTSNHH